MCTFFARTTASLVGRQRTDSSPILADIQRAGSDIVVQTQDGSVYALGVQ
jgi:hypothetical protein